MEHPIKMEDLGGFPPFFGSTPIWYRLKMPFWWNMSFVDFSDFTKASKGSGLRTLPLQFDLQEINNVRTIAKRARSIPEHSLFQNAPGGKKTCIQGHVLCVYVCVFCFFCGVGRGAILAIWCCGLCSGKCIFGCFHRLCPRSAAGKRNQKSPCGLIHRSGWMRKDRKAFTVTWFHIQKVKDWIIFMDFTVMKWYDTKVQVFLSWASNIFSHVHHPNSPRSIFHKQEQIKENLVSAVPTNSSVLAEASHTAMDKKSSLENTCTKWFNSWPFLEFSGQIIATSAEVTPNGGLVRESSHNPLNSGLGIIVNCPKFWSDLFKRLLVTSN